MEFALRICNRAPRYGLSQSRSSFYCWEDDFFICKHFIVSFSATLPVSGKFREEVSEEFGLTKQFRLGGFYNLFV